MEQHEAEIAEMEQRWARLQAWKDDVKRALPGVKIGITMIALLPGGGAVFKRDDKEIESELPPG